MSSPIPATRSSLRRIWPAHVPPVRRRELLAWASYDFANSGYTTVVITAVFNAWFVAVIAGGADWATLAWTLALSASYALVIVISPVLGVHADRHAAKKRWLALSTAVCVLATAALALCGPGMIGLAVVLIIVSNLAYSLGENLIAAFLPELAADDAMGRLSGYGWALGYVGGLVVLALCLVWIQTAPARGASETQAVPQSMLITAVLFALAAAPALLVLRERAQPQVGAKPGPAHARSVTAASAPIASRRGPAWTVVWTRAWSLSWARLRQALDSVRELTDLRRLLACIVCYQSGVATVITVAAIFTTQALGFSQQESIVLILVVNITAAIGAFAFGRFQDRLGHRLTLALTLAGWLLAIVVFYLADAGAGIWLAANLAGLCLGASQSAGRALVGYLCPPARKAEIFGLWGVAVRLAMIIGPVSYGLISWLSAGNHRAALLATAVFFIGGLLLLTRVDVERGHRQARAMAAPAPEPALPAA
ncbi:MAG: MFS transporter [Xanthomonadales bacterium]|nr:MFS transporter [Xanthomonadales bacterium]